MLERVKEIVFRVRETAEKAGLLYVLCIWKGPWDDINYRVGYFEETQEAEIFGDKLRKYYSESMQLPYMMYSSVEELDAVGNLEV